MDLNKHIVTGDDDSVLHSNGLARVDDNKSIGSASPVSFNQRLLIDNNRQVIGRYTHSKLGNAVGMYRPRQVTRSRGYSEATSIVKHNSASLRQKRFVEPKARNYNPYS